MQMPILVNKELLEKCIFGTGSACKIRGQGNLSEESKQTKNRKKKKPQRNPTKTTTKKTNPKSPQDNFLLNRSIFLSSWLIYLFLKHGFISCFPSRPFLMSLIFESSFPALRDFRFLKPSSDGIL